MLNIFMITIICGVCTVCVTPLVKFFACKMNAVDQPNHRKIHQIPIPTLGGLAIFIGFLVGILALKPDSTYHLAIILGATIIIIAGVLDDLFEFRAVTKFSLQVVAACVVVFVGGLQVEFINLPFGGQLEFGLLSAFFTIFWIVGIMNAINFIDGLDGLAAGISAIALFSIASMAIIMGDIYVLSMAAILFWSVLGFLPFNFYPAKIFMGDTGALFLGFMIAVLSLLGFKNVAVLTFIIPIFILAVPIFDTTIAIIRRFVHKRPISSPDSSHLHHRLLNIGMTHRQTVLFLYALSAMFSISALLLSMATVWGTILIGIISLSVIQMLIEVLGLIDSTYKPLTKFVKGLRSPRE